MTPKEKSVDEQLNDIVTALNLSARCKGVAQTAHYIGVERVSLSRTLKSARHMKLSTAVKIADALGMRISLMTTTEGDR